MNARPISAAGLASARQSSGPLALLDIRDPVEAERGHIPGATHLPRRRLEFRIGELVCDPATPIVVYGDADRRAELAARTLAGLGYVDIAWLEYGIAAWQESGGSLASGSNVPSKMFGEEVQHRHDVPAIGAETLLLWQRQGRRIVICDVRTPGEHAHGCIPRALSAPSFDIALHAADLAGSHDTLVLHCAGRTRSIVATRTLVEMGFDNVVALENGTMGWRLAGHPLEQASTRTPGEVSSASRERAERAAAQLAAAAGVRSLEGDALTALLGQAQCNRYVFDVRPLDEHAAGHIAGCTALPGGQAVQRADDFIALRGAPIVLIDEGEARANLTGCWLKRMGFLDVSVLAGGVEAWRASGRPLAKGRARGRPLGLDAAAAATAALVAGECAGWRAEHADALLLDVDTSTHFRRGHLPGAHWLPRSWLESRIAGLAPDPDRPVLVTCADGSQSAYAAATLKGMGYRRVVRLEGGTRAWAAAGGRLEGAPMPPQDDVLLAPYERGEQAMRDYIAWEKRLVPDAGSAAAIPQTQTQ